MGPQELNPAAPTQVGTGADGQPIYEGSLKDQSSPPDGGSAGGPSADDDASPEATADPGPNAGGDETATTPADTGDATFVGAQSDPDPDVIPIAGDSADDPNMGEAGDPTEPPQQFDAPPQDHVSPLFGPRPVIGPDDAWDGKALEEDAKRQEALERQRVDTSLVPAVDDHGATFADPAARSEPAAPRPSWVLPAAAAFLVLLGTVGFAATRGGGTPTPAGTTIPTASLAAPTTPPTATVTRTTVPTVAPAAARVTDTKVNEQGNVCLDQTVMTVIAKIDGAKAGDTVVFKLSGPGLPATVSGQLDGSGSVSATMGTVGPVKGNQTWSAAVQSVGGTDVVSGPSQVFGFCPNN